jgi:hypothetical protein
MATQPFRDHRALWGLPAGVEFQADTAGRVKLADPGFGNRTMSVRKFTSAWQGGVGFVVVP